MEEIYKLEESLENVKIIKSEETKEEEDAEVIKEIYAYHEKMIENFNLLEIAIDLEPFSQENKNSTQKKNKKKKKKNNKKKKKKNKVTDIEQIEESKQLSPHQCSMEEMPASFISGKHIMQPVDVNFFTVHHDSGCREPPQLQKIQQKSMQDDILEALNKSKLISDPKQPNIADLIEKCPISEKLKIDLNELKEICANYNEEDPLDYVKRVDEKLDHFTPQQKNDGYTHLETIMQRMIIENLQSETTCPQKSFDMVKYLNEDHKLRKFFERVRVARAVREVEQLKKKQKKSHSIVKQKQPKKTNEEEEEETNEIEI